MSVWIVPGVHGCGPLCLACRHPIGADPATQEYVHLDGGAGDGHAPVPPPRQNVRVGRTPMRAVSNPSAPIDDSATSSVISPELTNWLEPSRK